MKLFSDLEPNAKEVMGQLFLFGPQYDGCLVSKVGRDVLVDAGLADRAFGWQWLTEAGVQMAVTADVKGWNDPRWRKKQTM